MGLRSLSAAQFTKCNTHRLIAPAPSLQARKPSHSWPEPTVSLGPPASAPPHRRPLPESPALPPTWRSGRRGEGASVPHTPGPRGRDCTPNLPQPPPLGLASLPLFRSPNPTAEPTLLQQWLPATRGLLASPLISWFPDRGLSPTPHDTALPLSSKDRGDRAVKTQPLSLPLNLEHCSRMAKTCLPVPGLTLSRQFTFSVGYTILPHRAQLGFMAPRKAGAGTPELARVLFPPSELAGDSSGCNYTGWRRPRQELENWPPPPPSFP